MSDEQQSDPREEKLPIRRRSPQPERTDSHTELEPYGAAQEPVFDADTGIAQGRRFTRPETEFPHWDAIRETVLREFIQQSGTFKGGPNALMQEGPYYELVQKLVLARTEWGVAPMNLGRLVDLLRIYQFGYGALHDYMQIDGLEDLYFNSWHQGYYLAHGLKHRIDEPVFRNEAELFKFVEGVARANGLEINTSKPALDATLADGSRLNAMIAPISLSGANFVIRRHRDIPFTLQQMQEQGVFTAEFLADLKRFVNARWTICVSGGTSSGKTSLLNSIIRDVMPKDDRLLIIENRKEIQAQTEDTVFLQTREDAMRSNDTDFDMEMLIRQTLRQRPDRIIVGEVRGAEALDALMAWSTGHDGSLCTVHANSAPAAIRRLETLAKLAGQVDQESIRSIIADSLDIIIQVTRLRGQGVRRVVEVIQVLHQDKFDHQNPEVMARVKELNSSHQLRSIRGEVLFLPLYRFDYSTNQLVKVHEPIPIVGKEL